MKESKSDAADANKGKILIIDDEKTVCDSCMQVFQQDGYRVAVCQEGVSGLQKFDDFEPDIVFVDLKMPGMSGEEVIEEIRKRDRNVVQVVITGYATVESAVQSMKKGAFDFLPKPFTVDELRVITQRALEKRITTLEANRLQEEKEKMRRNFHFLVSHELKTPLAAVMQYLEVLSQSTVGELTEEQSSIIQRMRIRIRELLDLIERWLKLSVLEDSALREGFKDFDLDIVINDIIEMLKPHARERKVTLNVSRNTEHMIIHGDEDLMKEVFVNLVNNGIKYNHDGGTVSVKTGQQGDSYVIDVIDTGIGIAKEEIPHIIEEFYRVSDDKRQKGAGLGLAIVKKILDVHDGELQITSTLNKGSTFRVYLPVRQENRSNHEKD